MKTLRRYLLFIVHFASIFCALGALDAQIIDPQGSNQFRTTLATGGTYMLRDTGTYYKNPGSWKFANMSFSNTGAGATSEAAVFIDADGRANSATFTGSNLEILAQGTSGNARRGLMLYRGGIAHITDSVIRQTETNATSGVTGALYLNDGGSFYGTNVLIEANGPQMTAILLNDAAQNLVVLERSVIRNTGSAAAMDMAGAGVLLLTSSTVTTTGAVAPGLLTRGGIARFALKDGLIHVSGANSPGAWLGSGNIRGGIAQFEGTFENSAVRADDGMGIEINTNLPGLVSRPSITNPTLAWAGYYDLIFVSSTISGAHGAVRMTSSSTGSTVVSEIPTSVRMTLRDSTLDGDVFVNDGAKLMLNGAASRIDGALRLSGSAPVADVALNDFTITHGIVLAGGATLNLAANDATITGTFTASGASTARVVLTGSSTIDAVSFSGNSTLELTMDNTSRILGAFTFSDGATYTLLPADNRALTFANPLTLAARGTLRVAPGTNLTLAAPLTLADSTALITLVNARNDDLVLAAGLIGKGHLIVQGVSPDAIGQSELRVVRDDTGALVPDSFTLAAPASNRLFAYHGLENRPDGAYLTDGGFSSAGAAILDTSALAAADFFDAFTPAFRHLAGLRESATTGAERRDADADSGTLWLTGRTGDTSASGARSGLAFDQQTIAFATGADLRWGGGDDKPTFVAGIFADTGFTTRDFDNDADGNGITYGAGIYGLYQHTAGWHIAATVRVEAAKNDFDTRDIGATLSANYSTRSAGAALEFGWQLPGLSDTGWWCEPSVGVGFASLGSVAYDTHSTNPDNVFHVAQNAATAVQTRAQIAFGRNFDKKWSLRARLAASHLDISGGKIFTFTDGVITAADVNGARFHQLDGVSAEASAGVVYRFGPTSRIWLDCDTAIAADYKRPWALTIGWSMDW